MQCITIYSEFSLGIKRKYQGAGCHYRHNITQQRNHNRFCLSIKVLSLIKPQPRPAPLNTPLLRLFQDMTLN
jgi:hypothetical protein